MPPFCIAPREAASGSTSRELVATVREERFWLTLPAALAPLRRGGVPMHPHLPTAGMAAATLGCSNETPAQASNVSALRSSTAAPPTLTPQVSGTPSGLIAVSPVSSRIVWVSGRFGTYAVTTDGGA